MVVCCVPNALIHSCFVIANHFHPSPLYSPAIVDGHNLYISSTEWIYNLMFICICDTIIYFIIILYLMLKTA